MKITYFQGNACLCELARYHAEPQHTFGNGEVDSSILSGSTSFSQEPIACRAEPMCSSDFALGQAKAPNNAKPTLQGTVNG